MKENEKIIDAEVVEDQKPAELVPVFSLQQEAIVAQNLSDLHAVMDSYRAEVAELPLTLESLPIIKDRRKTITAYVDGLETQRKAVKAAVMAPYEAANAQYNQLVRDPYRDLDAFLKGRQDEIESEAKKACELRLRSYFEEGKKARGIEFELPFERMGMIINMTLARQKTPKKAMEQIDSFLDQVFQTVKIISGMEDYMEVMGEYVRCLDLSQAVATVNARKKAKAEGEAVAAQLKQQEEERKRREQEAADAVRVAPVPQVTRQAPPAKEEQIFRFTFSVTGTKPMLRGLIAFMKNNGINFEEVK